MCATINDSVLDIPECRFREGQIIEKARSKRSECVHKTKSLGSRGRIELMTSTFIKSRRQNSLQKCLKKAPDGDFRGNVYSLGTIRPRENQFPVQNCKKQNRLPEFCFSLRSVPFVSCQNCLQTWHCMCEHLLMYMN